MSLKHVVVDKVMKSLGGGTGYIGKRLIDLLSQQGITCTIVSREPDLKQNKITWIDVERNGLPKDTSAVVNLAGQNVLDPRKRWSEEFKTLVYDSRIKTTRILALAAETVDATLVTISGVAYYKPNDVTYTEESQCEPYDFLSELCHEWEAAARLPEGTKPIRQVVIRSGVALGRDGGLIKHIYWPFYSGLGATLGSGNQYMPWIHVTDLINMFLFAMKNDKVSGILNGVAPELVTNKQFTKAFASAMKRPAFLSVPRFMLDMTLHKERAKMLLEGQKVLPKRAKELGFEHQYPDLNSAFKEILS